MAEKINSKLRDGAAMTPVDWQRIEQIVRDHRFTANVTEWLCTCGTLLADRLVHFSMETIEDNLAEAREAHDAHLRKLIEGEGVNDDS